MTAAHVLAVEENLAATGTDPDRGLSLSDARARLADDGPNELPSPEGRGVLARIASQFNHPLIYILLASAAATGLLGAVVDASVILGVVVVNAVIGFLQEGRAERALDALAAAGRTEATAVRDGVATRIASADLVRGDLVLLDEGDQVPADLRLLSTRELRVDESALTGESQPAAKDTRDLPVDTEPADRTNMAHAGTLVSSGGGRGLVVATASATEIGRVHHLVSTTRPVDTPLTRKLARFSGILTVVILALAAVGAVVGTLRGQPFTDVVTAAVALAVGAIPEGLPAAVTVTLAIGVARMARRQAVIRHLPAVETLGSTTVICTDKTGTLTANAMTVTTVVAGGRRFAVTGAGYGPDSDPLPDDTALRACLLAGLACNDARVELSDGRWSPVGDPTEAALAVSAGKTGLTARDVPPREDTLPFSSDRRYMATLHKHADGTHTVYLKGSVERLAGFAADPHAAQELLDAADRLAREGLRVLATGSVDLPAGDCELTEALFAGRVTLLGVQGMHDPPRPAAIAAVADCRAAGVRVKMITGDHPATASAVATSFGLDPAAVTGRDLRDLTPERLREVAERTSVFARVSPEQKLALVGALQEQGHVVAMTGDGVNDAPALRRADIGVAMGRGGTEVARQAADMVLADDDFASIAAAVEEGRSVFDNLRKFIAWTLPTNLAEGLVILAATLVGTTLPILPVQILWINMTTAVALGLTLAFEPREPKIMTRPPLPPALPLLTKALVSRILLVSALLLGGTFAVFSWRLAAGVPVEQARTVAVNLFVAAQIAYLFNCRSPDRPRVFAGMRQNLWLPLGIAVTIALQMAFTYAPWMNSLFKTAPIGWSEWAAIAGIAGVCWVLIELDKRWRAHRRSLSTPERESTP
ncbi:cation-translocating P-type ATPase [Amycolatopsis sp. lyj-108]|uniref:cation-translocating P-type ATPase n=1 Tax=Amycolatopsis sp. lyj-108 TaxID=2789286 RepID=UPI00397E483C